VQFPDPNGYAWQLVTDGLESPVGLDHAGDGSGRLFVLEQRGRIRILSGGELLPEPLLDITDRVGSGGNEQGLLGIAFHPQFTETGLFYVNYTDGNGNTQIARFSVSPDDPNRADPDSETQVLFVEQPYPNHNGGSLAFGPDGMLYLGLGDGGAGGDPHGYGQATGALLGKVLRIDVAGPGNQGGQAYSIPPDNPFAAGGGAPEIWALGLRNPWRFSFDRLTGDLYIGDVGQGDWEEIDIIPAGSRGVMNFGWNIMEGMQCFGRADCSTQGLFLPAAVVGTHADDGCAVTGGYVYRGPALPEWQGIYLFGDYCNGRVWGLRPLSVGWDHQLLFQTPHRITSFGEDEAGEVYLLDRAGGVYRLESGS
jgi:glucose/arabinose dehydrogenase